MRVTYESKPAIDPGEDYDILPIGSVCKKGDEFTIDGEKWRPVNESLDVGKEIQPNWFITRRLKPGLEKIKIKEEL